MMSTKDRSTEIHGINELLSSNTYLHLYKYGDVHSAVSNSLYIAVINKSGQGESPMIILSEDQQVELISFILNLEEEKE